MERMAIILAWLSALFIAGQWFVVLPLFAMGAVDDGMLEQAFLVAAFFGWPVAAAATALAAGLLSRRPRLAALLLLPAVAAGLPASRFRHRCPWPLLGSRCSPQAAGGRRTAPGGTGSTSG